MAQKDDVSKYNLSIVRIWKNSEVQGVGFFIAQLRILTCAHVIDSALGHRLDFSEKTNLESNLVTLDFPLRSPRKKTKSRVIFYDPDTDLAVLELIQSEYATDGVAPAAILDNHKLWGHSFRAFGFPENIDDGVWVNGKMLGENASEWMQIQDNDLVGHFVEKGFSGGPVWDEQIQAIIGMIVAFEVPDLGAQNQRTAFFIPNQKIAEKWPNFWDASFDAISKQWNRQTISYFEEREHDMVSPLSDAWRSYVTRRLWKSEVEETISKIVPIAEEHKELLPFSTYLASIDFNENYERIWNFLKQVVKVFEDTTSNIVYGLITQMEKELDVTCGELYKRRQSQLSEREEKLLRLNSIPQKIRDLNNRYVINTEFNQCFLVMGEMGSGKSYFINSLTNRVGTQWVTIIHANYPEENLSEAICRLVSQASGINWPDLESINEYLTNCEKYTFTPHKLSIVLDDLSRFGLLHSDFLEHLTELIRDSTPLHNLLWILTAPEAYYVHLAAFSTSNHSFWPRYGFSPRGDSWPAVDKWIVLDDLDRSEEVGIEIIRGFLTKLNQEHPKLNIQFNEILEEEINLKELLCNPLIAWIWLDHIRTVIEQNSALERDWKYIQFINEFWKKQARLLIEKEENRKSTNPLNEAELRKFVLWIVRYLRSTGDIFPSRSTLLHQIIAFSGIDHTPISQERANFMLDNLKQGLIIREHLSESLFDEPDAAYEILMDGFWGSLLSHQIFTQITSTPKSSSELEQYFDTIHFRLRRVTLEFLLWIIDSKAKQPEITFGICNLVLQSSKLSHSAVWRMGIRANQKLQKALALRAKQYIKKNLDAETTYAMMSFLCKLPLSVIGIPERFALYQIMYPSIKKYSLASYFYYVVQRLFAQIENIDDLLDSLPYFSNSEALGLTEDLAEFVVDVFLKIEYQDGFISAENSDRSIKHVISYLDKIKTEYPDHRQIPNQSKGWNRYLFREWFLYFYFSEMTEGTGVDIYDVLRDLGWYRYRENRCLKKHMEQEANIAIGRLYRWRASYGGERTLSTFINDLIESNSSIDRQNAFFIIYHTVPTMSGELIEDVSSEFEDALKTLYSDSALSKIRDGSLGKKIFGQFGLGSHK
jgi:hypothetical protein